MVQRRWRPGDNRRDPGQPVHDHHGGGGANWRAGKPISTEWAIHRFADRDPHQAAAAPCGTPAFPERAGPNPDRAAAPADEHHPPGDVELSYLHPDVHPDPYAELGGTDHELVGVSHQYVDLVDALAKHHARAGQRGTARGSVGQASAEQPVGF